MHATDFNPYNPQALLPPGGRLVLGVSTGNNTEQIVAVNADGTGEMRLTNSAAYDMWPVWSPDGSRIAFCSDRTGSDNIFTMDGYGRDVRQVTQADPLWRVGAPSWAPDGRRIVFPSRRSKDGKYALYIIHAGGSRERLLLDDPGANLWSPAWSPAGDPILFASETGEEPSKIEVIRPDGTGRRVLASHSQLSYSSPGWSPDGRSIVFMESGDSPRIGRHGSDILLMSADGSNIRPISELPTPGGCPSWSPDGRHITFYAHSYCEDRDFQVYIMNADGTGISRPYYNDLGAGPASWGPVYYFRGQGLVPQGRVFPMG